MSDEVSRIRFAFIAMGLVAGANIIGALTGAGWRWAAASTAINLFVMVAWTARTRDPVMLRWLLIGLVAGWIEITTDWWLVAKTTSLVYPGTEPKVLVSPLYMPFAWTIVLAQIGVIGGWLAQRMPLAAATLATALLGGTSIPFYEHLAHDADYWYYHHTPMLFNAPYYIIVSEFLLSLPLPWLYRLAVARSLRWSLLCGLAAGAWMLPSVWIGWWLVGPCSGAVIQFACR
jgi:hypothetical protein